MGDWTFKASKSKDSGFGDAFNLNIKKSSEFSYIVDLENPPAGIPTTLEYRTYYEYGNGLHLWSQHTLAKGNVKIVSTDLIGEPTLGSQSLQVSNGQQIKFFFSSSDNYAHLAKNFSVDIYNTDLKAFTILIEIKPISGNAFKDVYEIVLKPGVNHFNLGDIAGSGKVGAALIESIIITNTLPYSYAYTPNILVDNFSWESRASSIGNFSLAAEENDLHSFSGVEEFAQSEAFGSEVRIDTLEITGKDQLIDLSALRSKIDSIEIFDITGASNNILKLDLNALLQHGEKELFIKDGKTQLMVKGNEGDVVQLKDILPAGSDLSEWQHQEGTVTVAGVEYQVYRHDDAELLVQQGVKTELV